MLQDGIYLQDMRGLNFYLVLERLALLHFGKHRSMSYATQAEEYDIEVRHISLHLVQAMVGFWVFKKRQGSTVNNQHWPYHRAWRAYPMSYNVAVEGAAATRIETLRILLSEVQRSSKPKLMNKRRPPMGGLSGDGSPRHVTNSCCGRDSGPQTPGTPGTPGSTRPSVRESVVSSDGTTTVDAFSDTSEVSLEESLMHARAIMHEETMISCCSSGTELKKIMSEDPTLASPRTPSTATTSANPLMEPDYEENGTTATFDENGPMEPSRSAKRAHLAHPGKGNIDRLTELESWKIFQMLDVSGNGLLYSSDIQRFLGMIDEDNIYTDEDVNYWMEDIDDDENGCLDFTEFQAFFEQLTNSKILLGDQMQMYEDVDAELDEVVKDLDELKEDLMDNISS